MSLDILKPSKHYVHPIEEKLFSNIKYECVKKSSFMCNISSNSSSIHHKTDEQYALSQVSDFTLESNSSFNSSDGFSEDFN